MPFTMEYVDEEVHNQNLSYTTSDNNICKRLIGNGINTKIMHQNIRSINKNFDELLIQLHHINVDFDIIILTECWLSNNYTPKILKNYTSHNSTIFDNQNDGIVVYTKNNQNFTVTELEIQHASCTQIKYNNDTVILAIYRSPSIHNITPFLSSLSYILSNLSNTKHIIIIGDLNINILPNNQHPQSQDYINMLEFHGLVSTVNSPTRTTNGSKSCIDHIMVKSKKPSKSIVYQSTITDHYSTIFAIQTATKTNKCNLPIVYNKINFQNLITNFKNKSWHELFQIKQSEDAWIYFVNYLKNEIHNHSTTLTKNISNKLKPLKPWINHSIINCIHKRNKLHKKTKDNPYDQITSNYYKRYRNMCCNVIRKAKEIYYSEKIKESNNNPKKLWEILREATNSQTKKEKQSINKLSIDGRIVETTKNPKLIADHVNNFFINIGPNLASQIPQSEITRSTETEDQANNKNIKFLFQTISKEEILRTIKSLKNTSSAGPDEITTKILKILSSEITLPLEYLINLSITQGYFPSNLKQSIVIPIYKSGNKSDTNNYRPITLLNSLSKVFENLINAQLLKFVVSHKILSENQYGFQKNKSTSDAIASVTDFIVKSLDKGKKCISIFLDLSKAFDTISHVKLIQKLEKIGITDKELNFFKSYLNGRKQQVKIQNTLSDQRSTDYGIPQGSVLGPTLFLLYINNFCNLEIQGKIVSFADDTVLLFEDNNWPAVFKKAQRNIYFVKKWLDINTLTLNTKKTKYVTSSINTTGQPNDDYSIKIHSCSNSNECSECPSIERTSQMKYLGLTIDPYLKWNLHTQIIANKIRKTIHFFRSIRNFLNLQLLKTIYFAITQSILEYGIIAWGGGTSSALDPVEKAQKTIMKIILKLPLTANSDLIFNKMRVFDVRQIYVKTILMHLFKNKHVLYEKKIYLKFTRNSNKDTLQVPALSTTFGQRSYRYFATKIFNMLPDNIKLSQTQKEF